jgi:hypothetical protein
MISSDTVEVSVKYDRTYKFFLRLISIAEENQLRQRPLALTKRSAPKRNIKSMSACLADLSVKMPDGIEAKKGKSIGDAVSEFFREKNALKERIAFFAIRAFFLRIQPSDFF